MDKQHEITAEARRHARSAAIALGAARGKIIEGKLSDAYRLLEQAHDEAFEAKQAIAALFEVKA